MGLTKIYPFDSSLGRRHRKRPQVVVKIEAMDANKRANIQKEKVKEEKEEKVKEEIKVKENIKPSAERERLLLELVLGTEHYQVEDSTTAGSRVLRSLLEAKGFRFFMKNEWETTWSVICFSLSVQLRFLEKAVRPKNGQIKNLPVGISEERDNVLDILLGFDFSTRRRCNMDRADQSVQGFVKQGDFVIQTRPWKFIIAGGRTFTESPKTTSLFDQLLAATPPDQIDLSDVVWSQPTHYLELCHKILGMRFFDWPVPCDEFPLQPPMSFSVPLSLCKDANFKHMVRIMNTNPQAYTCVSVDLFKKHFGIDAQEAQEATLTPETQPMGKNAFVWVSSTPTEGQFLICKWPRQVHKKLKRKEDPIIITSAAPSVKLNQLVFFLYMMRMKQQGMYPLRTVAQHNGSALVAIDTSQGATYHHATNSFLSEWRESAIVLLMLIREMSDVEMAAITLASFPNVQIGIVTNDSNAFDEFSLSLPIVVMNAKKASATTEAFTIVFVVGSCLKFTRMKKDPIMYIFAEMETQVDVGFWKKMSLFCCSKSWMKNCPFEQHIAHSRCFRLNSAHNMQDLFLVGSNKSCRFSGENMALSWIDVKITSVSKSCVKAVNIKTGNEISFNKISSLRLFETWEGEYYSQHSPFARDVTSVLPVFNQMLDSIFPPIKEQTKEPTKKQTELKAIIKVFQHLHNFLQVKEMNNLSQLCREVKVLICPPTVQPLQEPCFSPLTPPSKRLLLLQRQRLQQQLIPAIDAFMTCELSPARWQGIIESRDEVEDRLLVSPPKAMFTTPIKLFEVRTGFFVILLFDPTFFLKILS